MMHVPDTSPGLGWRIIGFGLLAMSLTSAILAVSLLFAASVNADQAERLDRVTGRVLANTERIGQLEREFIRLGIPVPTIPPTTTTSATTTTTPSRTTTTRRVTRTTTSTAPTVAPTTTTRPTTTTTATPCGQQDHSPQCQGAP